MIMIKNIINILLYILNKIRFVIGLWIILFIALPFVPLIIFTKWSWSWLWLLIIINEKCCSLSKAKKLYLKNKDNKYGFKPSNEVENSDGVFDKLYYDAHHSPICSYMPSNIFHKRGYND